MSFYSIANRELWDTLVGRTWPEMKHYGTVVNSAAKIRGCIGNHAIGTVVQRSSLQLCLFDNAGYNHCSLHGPPPNVVLVRLVR